MERAGWRGGGRTETYAVPEPLSGSPLCSCPAVATLKFSIPSPGGARPHLLPALRGRRDGEGGRQGGGWPQCELQEVGKQSGERALSLRVPSPLLQEGPWAPAWPRLSPHTFLPAP